MRQSHIIIGGYRLSKLGGLVVGSGGAYIGLYVNTSLRSLAVFKQFEGDRKAGKPR